MKPLKLTAAALALSLAAAPATSAAPAQEPAAAPAAAQETPAQKEERMEWFDHAKLGIFIHWGIYSVRGVPESWSFFNGYLSHDEYMRQLDGFTAENFDPREWLDLIKESGAQYTVITAKHHDGVALWHTKLSNLNVVDKTPARRDLIEPFVAQARAHGLKLGFYYSLPDWSDDRYNVITRQSNRYDIAHDPARWESFKTFQAGQLAELSRWKPDLLWFDGDWEHSPDEWDSPAIVSRLRAANPRIIVNSRIGGSLGDYATPEQGVPVVRPADRYWELCMTMNDSWGYQHTDTNYKTPHMLLRTFVDCLSNGGNLLLDIGPRADGTIPPEQVAILKEFARWTKKHKEAIYPTRAGILPEHFQGYTTLNQKGDILYLYLPYKPNGPIEIKGLMNQVNRAWVVGNGAMLNYKVHNKNYWSPVPGNLYIDVPPTVLDPQITVIALLLDGPAKLYRGPGKVIESN